LEARMIAPITEVIETALEMSSRSVGFIRVPPVPHTILTHQHT
jgi:hypothetical protein